ncbi:hypothetical protein C5E44_01940 [Nocardia nova]|uniref:hypothetical protein n=1 Tax=Nocardia nova TaxID=37330 RepID=UPI000CEA58E5|nr:hypothetical protein C5E44_01940 [Nocardia nova]
MSGGHSHRPEHDIASQLIATPKSSIWQGFLGAAWVMSSSLLLEVVAKLLEGSVGQSRVLNSLAGVLRWVAVAVVAAAALYVLWRKTMDMREGARIRRELDLTADLVQPPPVVERTVAALPASAPAGARPLDEADTAVADVLRALPFTDYEAAALYDTVTAMLDSATVLPGEQAVPRRSTGEVLIRLAAHGVIVHHGHDRFAVDTSPNSPDLAVIRRTPQWRAAWPALIRHYSDRATRWAVALDSDRLGAGAHRWFTGSADRLAELVRECDKCDHGIELDIPALARIADALDLWYARIGKPSDGPAARAMVALSEAAHPQIHELASIRCGLPPDTATRRRWPRPLRRRSRPRRSTGLHARRAHAEALRDFDRLPGGEYPLPEIVAGFERAWWLLPRRDIAAEVCALNDLAIAHLYEGRLDAARDRLELAETLTRGGRHPSGRAHTFETLGLLWWMRGEPRRAMRWWLLALTRYRDLGHELGICRCLQHLGSAVAVTPEYGGLLLAGPLSTGEVLRQASGWLAYAARCRPGGTGRALAARYRRRVAHALENAQVAPLETVDRWPVTVSEH